MFKPDPDSTSGAHYLTVDWSGASPVIYAVTTNDSVNKIIKVIDDGATTTGTVLATAGANQQFRGIRFGPTSEAPTITTSPVSQTKNYGENVTFTGAATGTSLLSYQWNKEGGASGLSTTTSLTLSSLTYADHGSYNFVVTNELGSASQTATLNVNDPYISSAVQNQSAAPGDASAVFSVTAAGSGTVTYVWKKGETVLSEGSKYTGVTSSSLTILNIVGTDEGS